MNNATQRTVTRLAKTATAPDFGVIEERGRIVIDREHYVLHTQSPGYVLNIREAAHFLGMPVSVLRLLRELGLYEVVHMGPGLPGFHQCDLEHFKNRLRAAALRSPLGLTSHGAVSVSEVVRRRNLSCRERASLVEALIAGTLSCFADSSEDGSSLFIPELHFVDWVKAIRRQSTDVNGIDACSLLHCDFDTLRALIGANHITGTSSGGRWRISRISALNFSKQYAPMTELAAELESSSRKASVITQKRP